MTKLLPKQHPGNTAHPANRLETTCNCGRTVALCAATYVSFCNDEGMKIGEEQASAVLLQCHAYEHEYPQTLMVSLFPAQEVAA